VEPWLYAKTRGAATGATHRPGSNRQTRDGAGSRRRRDDGRRARARRRRWGQASLGWTSHSGAATIARRPGPSLNIPRLVAVEEASTIPDPAVKALTPKQPRTGGPGRPLYNGFLPSAQSGRPEPGLARSQQAAQTPTQLQHRQPGDFQAQVPPTLMARQHLPDMPGAR